MAGENLHLSMLLTAQAEQARRELAATALAARELGKAGPEVTTAWTGAKPALEATAQAGRQLGGVASAVSAAWSGVPPTLTGAATAAASVQGAVAGLNRETRTQAAALVATARETAAYRTELDALRARFNPIFAASRAYEQQLREIADAERFGAISAMEAAAARDRASAGLVPMNTAMTRLGRTTSVNVMHSANLAAQFNDIGVMAMAMQNPLQLAVQQGTQVNQVFGQMGGWREGIRGIGPALRQVISPASLATIAVIALGAAGVQALLSLREEAVSVEDAIAELNTAMDELEEATRLASPRGLEDLERQYGRVTSAVLALAEAEERAARRRLENQLQSLQDAQAARAGSPVSDGFGGTDISGAIVELRDQLGLLRDEAPQVYRELSRIGDITGPAELADTYAYLIEVMEAVEARSGRLNDEQSAFLDGLIEAEEVARRLAAIDANRGQWDNTRADQMLAENALAEAILRYGEDSRIVTEMRAAAERQAYQEMLRTLDVSEELKERLQQSWDAGRGLAALDMASGIARARAEAQAMADEIMRAVGAAQSLAAQGAASLEDARIRSQYTSPVDQAYHLGAAQMRRAQGVRRDGAEGLELAALDAEVNAAGRAAAETARLNEERTALNRTRRDGARASEQEREAVGELITDLQQEIDILRETDPVQQEMLRHREVLAAATEAERAEIEQLIRTRIEESEVNAENQRQMEGLRDLGRDVLRGIAADLRAGASAGEILANVLDKLADKLIDMGTSSLADLLFGQSGSSSGGFLGDLFRGLFGGGVTKNALGDVVGAPTLFAYGDKPGQLGVMGEAGAEAIMPLTHAMGPGVGAIAGGHETTLPLTRLSSGKLGVSLPPDIAPRPFAQGGSFGFVPAPPTRAAQAATAATPGQAARAEIIGQLQITHSRDFEVRWTGRMQGVAAEVVEEGLRSYDRMLPSRVEQISLDPAMKG